ncbi:MAG: hypothetical protein Tsb0015_11280 [Simkaniaceae bacterium]
MITSLILNCIGFALLYLEFFLPGGIVGGIGGLLFLAGFIVFALEDPGPLWIAIYLAVLVILIALVIRIALWHIRRSGKKLTMFLDRDQEGYKASAFEKKMVGKRGKAITDLGPSGHVSIEGESFQALSRSGYLTKGSAVEVTGGQGAYLVVKPCKEE